LTSELILIATILVIGLIVGMVTIRDAITAEMEDTAEALGSLDQSYAYQGMTNAEGTGATAGSSFGDAVDALAGDEAEFVFQTLDQTESVSGGFITSSPGASSSVNPGAFAGSLGTAVQ